MKAIVFLETDRARKRELLEHLSALLPAWFGQPASNARYAQQAEILDGYVAEIDDVRRGLLLVKWTAPTSAESFWLGVDPTCHRSGVGRALVEAASEAARKRGVKYLFVATLHPDDPYEPYLRTRMFYEALGFAHVLEEQFPSDSRNPLAHYLKQI
jgi:N-acetylglutamate synthase-like GNAT family acetyltransferase